MQVKNKLFPYPILNRDTINSSYFNKSFNLVYDYERTKEGINLNNIRFETNSEYLTELYKQGKIGIVCIVECSQTVLRKYYPISNLSGQSIKICSDDFNGKVELSMFAYAKEDLVLNSNELLEDYSGIDFAIDKYDILAVNDGFTFKFSHLENEGNMVKSIFCITIDDNLGNNDPYSVTYDAGSKINIYLSREQHEKYSIIFSTDIFKEVFFNMLLIPVLTEAFTMIKKSLEDEEQDIDDICRKYTWFYSVKNGYKKLFDKELTKDIYLEYMPVALAQEILGKPLGTALTNIIEVINENKGDDTNE